MIIKGALDKFFLLTLYTVSLCCMNEESKTNIHLDTDECRNRAGTVLQKRSYLDYVSHEISSLVSECTSPTNEHSPKKSRQADSTEMKLIDEEYKDGEKFESLHKLFTQNPLIIPTPRVPDHKSRFKIPAWLISKEERANKEQQKAMTCRNANIRTFLYAYFSKIFHNNICDNHGYIHIMQHIVLYAGLKG